MTREKFFKLLGTTFYGSWDACNYKDIDIHYYSLQFFGTDGWIYNYRIYNRNMEYPMYGVRDNLACIINNDKELKAFGDMARQRGGHLFTNYVYNDEAKAENNDVLYEKIKNDKNILHQITSYDEKYDYFLKLGTKIEV